MSNPRRLAVTYSITVEFEVPEDFPLTAEEVRETADWKGNDWRDGRHPFSSELMHDGAERAARYAVSEAIFQHYARRVEKAFPPKPPEGYNTWRHIEGRNKLVDRCWARVRRGYVSEGGQIGITVKIHPETVTCPNCGQETLKSWRRCPCNPDMLLPGVEPRPWEAREAQRLKNKSGGSDVEPR